MVFTSLSQIDLSKEVFAPSYGNTDAFRPCIAFGKDVYLLVWQAGRNEQADIVGVRLDKSGLVMDKEPFVISSAQDSQEQPRVAFGGGVFFVVWHDLRNGKDWDVYGVRVTCDGKVLEPGGIAIGVGERNQCEPDVCWDGKNFQVLWRGMQGDKSEAPGLSTLPSAGYHIFGARVSSQGKILDETPVLIAKPPREYQTPRGMGKPSAICLSEGHLLCAARSGHQMCVWRIVDGKPANDITLLTKCKGFDYPAFASNGKVPLLVWTTFRDGGGRSSGAGNFGMLLVNPEMSLATAEPSSISSMGKNALVKHPVAVWDGKRYIVIWTSPQLDRKKIPYEAIMMRFFAEDGTALENDVTVVNEPSSPAYLPTASSDGCGTTIIAYERHPPDGNQPVRIGIRILSSKQK